MFQKVSHSAFITFSKDLLIEDQNPNPHNLIVNYIIISVIRTGILLFVFFQGGRGGSDSPHQCPPALVSCSILLVSA